MAFEDDYSQKVLTSHITSTTTIALLNASGVELTAIGGYTRKAIGTLDLSIAGQVANTEIIFLFEATGSNTDTATQFLLYNGSTRVFRGELSSLPISAGYVPLIRAHNLIIGLDKAALEDY